jgi:hypothetical protein
VLIVILFFHVFLFNRWLSRLLEIHRGIFVHLLSHFNLLLDWLCYRLFLHDRLFFYHYRFFHDRRFFFFQRLFYRLFLLFLLNCCRLLYRLLLFFLCQLFFLLGYLVGEVGGCGKFNLILLDLLNPLRRQYFIVHLLLLRVAHLLLLLLYRRVHFHLNSLQSGLLYTVLIFLRSRIEMFGAVHGRQWKWLLRIRPLIATLPQD